MNDSEVTAKEKREAEALARALEGDGSAENVPSDALEVAGLLRVSGEDTGLSDVRRDAVLKKLLARAAPGKRQVPWLRWLVPAGGLAAAVAIFALTLTARIHPAPLPRPGKELIEAQASVASGNGQAVAVLRDRMRQYRREIYKTLAEHYKG